MSRSMGLLVLAGMAGGAMAIAFWQPWSSTSAGPAEPPKFGESRGTGGNSEPPRPAQFGEGRNPAEGLNVKAIPFDGDRAIKYLKELCDIGPRISGTEGMKKQQEHLVKHFEKYGATVTRQSFEAKQKSVESKVAMTNLIAKWHPERAKRIILCSHYDTRPHADEEEERAKWNKPFLSANDGTSGVAFLMEMAHHLKDLPSTYGVDIVLFDGEEYIFNKGAYFGEGDDFFLGSDYFGRDYDKNRKKYPWTYEAAVLFDLFAHKNARLAVEGYSWQFAPGIVDEIWKTAAALKAKSFKYERGFRRAVEVLDDHYALYQAAKIPSVDILDFDYEHWHKLTDLPDQCTAEQMKEVGLVIAAWLQTKK